MLTDGLSDRHHPRPPRRRRASSGWRWKRTLPVVAVVAVVALAVATVSSLSSSRQTGPGLTHTITRGDLIVTVTEQGILESAENTEITCQVRGRSTVIWVIESGTEVKPGDVLVRLDTLAIEDAIAERSKYAHWSRSSAERSRANVARAELAISQYLEGRYRADLMTMQKDLIVAESNLRSAQNILAYAETMAERGYASELDIQEKRFAVKRAELNVGVNKTRINVLEEHTKAMQLETLYGDLKAAKAKLAADEERAKMDAIRRDLALEELEYCVVKAERSGLVIHPSAARWENAPKIEEGTTVYKDQVLLLMPDLSKMQAKIGIRESYIDRVKSGMPARITLPNKTLEGEVSSVASVTRPAGWWTANIVRYDTLVDLPSVDGLKPGMSAEVEVIMARHVDVLTIPVAAVVERSEGDFCWVRAAEGTQRRSLRLGDTNNIYMVVEAGLKEGDEVVLNPLAFEEAQTEVLKPLEQAKTRKSDSPESGTKSKLPEPSTTKPSGDSNKQKSKTASGQT